MYKERKEILLAEIGKFFIDIAKIVFGGIILASFMRVDISQTILFVFGGIFVCVFTFAGLAFMALSVPADLANPQPLSTRNFSSVRQPPLMLNVECLERMQTSLYLTAADVDIPCN